MSYKDYASRIEFKGCRYDLTFKSKVEELITDIESGGDKYHGTFDLEVEKNNGNVETITKKSTGLSDNGLKILEQLETMAQDICKKGGEPSKVKAEVEVEREL